MKIHFKISTPSLNSLSEHLFPGDGKEAVAFILCGHVKRNNKWILLAHEVIPLSYDECVERKANFVRWKTTELTPVLDRAEKENLAIVKVHCHPKGYDKFSDIDNESDKDLFPSIYGWSNNNLPSLSVILLPDNKLVARHVSDTGQFSEVPVTVIGDEVKHYPTQNISSKKISAFEQRNLQVFGGFTRDVLSKMRVAVIGCSGTGGPVIEELNRLGIGELCLFDPDVVEHKNLNRITNTKKSDADQQKFKVDAIKDNLKEIGLSTKVSAFSGSIFEPELVNEIATCDFIFGCVDSAEARVLLNRISNFYLIPYIDIGICLDADGSGGVTNISGKVAYFQPGLSDHLTRRSVLSSTLEAESLKRDSPKEYEDRLNEGYIKGVVENSPAIIPVNTYASSLAVMEFLARVHDYRNEPNMRFSQQTFCFVNNFVEQKSEKDFLGSKASVKYLGRGDIELLLDMPSLSYKEKVA